MSHKIDDTSVKFKCSPNTQLRVQIMGERFLIDRVRFIITLFSHLKYKTCYLKNKKFYRRALWGFKFSVLVLFDTKNK